MYDGKKIIIGLIIFLAIISYPIWHAVSSNSASAPVLELPSQSQKCVESTEYMRSNHMKLLDEWRQSVVRDGNRTYTASDGQEYTISLTGTCLNCHKNTANFCDKCHAYSGVNPSCWSCHNKPSGGTP